MSLDDLKADLQRNVADLEATTMYGVDDLKKYLRETLWPFLHVVVEEMEELDSDISDMVEGSEDILQPETAGIFAVVIVQAMDLCKELETRLRKNDVADQTVKKKVAQLRNVCGIAQQTLMDITVHPDPSKDESNGNDPDGKTAEDDAQGSGDGADEPGR